MASTKEQLAAALASLSDAQRKTYNSSTAAEKTAMLELIVKKAIDAEKAKSNMLSPALTDTASQTNITSKDVLKLTPASAKALLQTALTDAQYTGKMSSADIADFTNKFQTEAAKQMAIVTKAAYESTKVGATPADLSKTVASYITTNFPSFFKPEDFAKNYAWSKINFKDTKTLGGNALIALEQARGVVASFHVLGISDAEVQASAKLIAMGKKSIADFTAEVQQVAIKEYPTLAERFKTDPTLSTKDAVSPVINMLAKVWEVDPATIGLDDPYVMSYLHPGGIDGKTPPVSYADLYRKAMNDPKREYTVAANEQARSAATSMARAFGFGV